MALFTDHVVLITGGGTGIGRACAHLFAGHGADIVVNYSRSEGDANETVAQVAKFGRQGVAIKADVSNDAEVRAMVENVADRFGRLDVLINNAGTTDMVPAKDLEGLTSDMWDSVMNVNVKGTFFCSRAAIPVMRANGGGQIINVSSIAGITGIGSSIAYAASKAAIINMTKSMALSQGPDIRVNSVAPGVVTTRWVKGWEHYTDPHRDKTPLKRLASPEDVAQAIYGLAISGFVTGEIMTVDGGRLLNV